MSKGMLLKLRLILHHIYTICPSNNPVSILYKSIAGRHRPVSYPYWEVDVIISTAIAMVVFLLCSCTNETESFTI